MNASVLAMLISRFNRVPIFEFPLVFGSAEIILKLDWRLRDPFDEDLSEA